jgi:uncharacterized protein
MRAKQRRNARKTQTCTFDICALPTLKRAIKQEIAHLKRARSHTECAQSPNLQILIQRAIKRKWHAKPKLHILNVRVTIDGKAQTCIF